MTKKSRRRGRIALIVLGILAAQLGAFWVYRRVEDTRAEPEDATVMVYERIESEPLALDSPLQRPDGRTVTLRSRIGEPLLVHFWATWCGPCRTELPKLVQLGRERGIRLLLVSVDQGWPVVRHFFDGSVPEDVVLDEGGTTGRLFGVSTLPDTYLVARSGRITVRFRGDRNWTDANVRKDLDVLLAEARRQ
jgi:thiol-disulfide isomerase/thioredoxin